MNLALSSPPYTPTEYLALEENATVKHEYLAGEIIEVAGATANHNLLVGKFHARLLLALEESNYTVFMSDMRLWIPQYNHYTYPDIMVIQGNPIFTDEKQTTLMNPALIIEVLSTSTQGYDKTTKFKHYRSISEFQEYILLEQNSYGVEQYTKQEDGRWLLTEYLTPQDTLSLDSVDFSITLQDLYKRVNLK